MLTSRGAAAAVRAMLVGAIGLSLVASNAQLSAAPDTLAPMEIDDPLHYWDAHGFAPMVPSIRLPTTHSADDLIQVWLSVPQDKRIDARYLPEQARWSLVFPPGTRSDRVEYFAISGDSSASGAPSLWLPGTSGARDQWTVADVRGTEVLPHGQRFHVLKPISGAPHAPLRGWSWQRGDEAGRVAATERLLQQAADTPRPAGRAALDAAGLRQLGRLNHCAHCHNPDRPRHLWQDRDVETRRATDTHGFFVPQAVLSDDCVVANHRPRDLNADDPFVTVRCGDLPATLDRHDGAEQFSCPHGRVPVGHRDVRAGLAAGDAYTRHLCESRRWLHQRMTERARGAFAPAFAVCGIGTAGV
jgi:hypothetical protein